MTLLWASQTVEKAGNSAEENEDQVKVRGYANSSRLRVAVADGATESSYSAQWARALVETWAETDEELNETFMGGASDRWKERLPPLERLPWYAVERLAEGSHATAAFLDIREDGPLVTWSAAVVGDCVVTIRRLRSRSTVPKSLPPFDATPHLLVSADPWGLTNAVRARGRTAHFREIWVATDALAAALLARGRRPEWSKWREALEDPAAFRQLVTDWRQRGSLRNDDVTLVRIWRE